jgi:tRNA nucleotidyltransferase (CCA-adding enzyme)
VAGLPVRRPELSDAASQLQPPRPPAHVQSILDRLWQSGHAVYLVGGGIRDWLLGRPATDWDIATDARPEQMLELFPTGHYENRFGTVTIDGVEATTFRRDHQYGDHRRPDSVTFTDDIVEDLARRDFTVNAIAFGRTGDGEGPADEPHWTDPTHGVDDLRGRLLRAVGEADRRFEEDALRLVRAARLAAELSFEIEPETRAAMARSAHLGKWVSRERVGGEFRRMVRAEPPSAAFRILAETSLLEPLFPELAAQIGVPQAKIPGADLWHHSLVTVDAAATLEGSSERLRVAALLHDIGKPTTSADGHFVGHDTEGARLAEEMLGRLAFGRREIEPVVALIGQHMFAYQSSWSGAAVRRFIRRVGPGLVDDLLRLRQADNVGSALPADAGQLDELRQRVATELQAGAPLSLRDLAVDGGVLTSELEIGPGPVIGRLLNHLLECVIADPSRNTPAQLLAEARDELARAEPAP